MSQLTGAVLGVPAVRLAVGALRKLGNFFSVSYFLTVEEADNIPHAPPPLADTTPYPGATTKTSRETKVGENDSQNPYQLALFLSAKKMRRHGIME